MAIPTVVHIKARTEARNREAVKALFSNKSSGRGPQEGEGSGVIYTSNGYVITNFHVVDGATDITVTTSDRKVFPASLVGQYPKSDLAVLRIEGTDLPYLKLADSDLVEPGSWVLAVGNPLGLTSTVTAGIISAKGRSISLLNDLDAIESFLQTDAAVNPGNSGGPLVTADGKLLGINTAIATKTGRFQGYSFAIPINLVQRIVDDIIEFGAYRRAFLGVEISTYTRADSQRLRLPERTEGVVIDAIFAGGSADAAGLQVDDLIIRVGKRTIRDLPELTELIGRAKVGEKLNLTVVRNGAELEVIVSMLAETAD
jgi:serine protease Do